MYVDKQGSCSGTERLDACALNDVAVEPMRLFSISKALGSNVGRDAEYPDRLFPDFTQSPSGKCGNGRYSKVGHGSFLITIYLTIIRQYDSILAKLL